MLEGVTRESRFGDMNNSQLKSELKKILREMGTKGKGIRMVTKQRLGGILIEAENDMVATWLRKDSNAKEFCQNIGPGTKFKTRTHELIAYNVPLTMEPANPNHLIEIHEVNQLDSGTIKSARWVKPIVRRSPSQRSAHLILSFTDVNAANRALSGGITVCRSRVKVGKIKKEPIRCLTCQKWNHYANECKASEDTCSNCAEPHRTNQCPNPLIRRCVSCKTSDHASWSRDCPMFATKTDEYNNRYPENDLLFIPSDEPWTWCTREDHPRRVQFNVDDFRKRWNLELTRERGQPQQSQAPQNWADEDNHDDIYA